MTRIAALILMAASLALAAGCGSSGTGGTSPNVAGSKQISTTTAAEKTSLCDWFVGMIGGYGAPTTCQNAFIEAPATQAECVSTFPTCAVTVGTFEACIETIVSAQTTCTSQSLMAAQTDATCQMVGAAGCFN
jgi:hypothetical protein